MLTKIRDGFGKWMTGVIIALISAGFVFWGINFQFNTSSYAAKVNGSEIALDDFQNSVQQQESQYQNLYKVDLTPAIRNQIKQTVLQQLIQQKALQQHVDGEGYKISDQRLAAAIRSVDVFQVGGKFNRDAYRNYLATRGVSPSQFEAKQRQQLALLDFERGVAVSSFVTPTEMHRYLALTQEQRQIGYALFKGADFASGVKVADAQVAAYYKANAKDFMTEEAVELKYIKLTRAEVAAGIKLTDADLEKYYNENKKQFAAPEEREADHILITPKKGETDAQTEARAEAVLKRIEGGADFAKVAKEVSEDPGTAAQGGALGWISRGMLEGPFEDKLFAMKVGQIAGPVKTKFGYHIIKLDKIRGGTVKSFAEVKDQLAKQLRQSDADDIFYKKSNTLANDSFDAYDELDSVAKKLGVTVKTIARFGRSGDAKVFANSAPVVSAVFGSTPLQSGTNSNLIKLSDDAVVVVNVGQHFPSVEKPLGDVSDQIRTVLVAQKAGDLAGDAAKAFMAALPAQLTPKFLGTVTTDDAPAAAADDGKSKAADEKSAKVGTAKDDKKGNDKKAATPVSAAAALAVTHDGTWVAPTWVGREDKAIPAELLSQAFKLGVSAGQQVVEHKLVSLPDGNHGVIVLTGRKAGTSKSMSADDIDKLREQLAQQAARTELGSYVSSVRKDAKVSISKSVLSNVE